MGKYTLKIKEYKFLPDDNNGCQIISPTEAIAGNWQCTITQDGLTCIANQDNTKIKYIIRKNGYCFTALYGASKKRKILKSKWLTTHGKFVLSGTLTLTDDKSYTGSFLRD